MSEGTMQRRAQRDGQFNQREERDERARRTGGLGRLLAAAVTVPVMLIAAGCSSDSGSDDGSKDAAAATGSAADSAASAAPSVQAAAYQKLPQACAVVSKKTLTELVPKGVTSGKEGTTGDTTDRASCSWSSLANNGVKGSQFRWLNVSLLRFESDATTGDGESQAKTYYAKQVKDSQAVAGATNAKSQPVAGTGDEATLVRYDLKKTEGAFKQQTVVARVENVVVTLDYNGAGLAGDKAPSADALSASAQKAAKEAVASVRSANGVGGGGSSQGSSAGPASPSPSKSSSVSPGQGASLPSSTTPKATASKAAAAAPKATASAKS
ncbi:DUF3558 domain-containing protein [Streptomyces sp. ID05-04B]|uniref:DUF3558 domain-containing protein n=1 Tax=unclassified Streptomyces TaxID=2593676 RepID=UPI000D19B5E5|nr:MULTISPECIES: DUF3558 domain-containing protein [unclassified Streptomyces]AVV41163.1 DUF3558 domain-containing protein [Streptomyces sp. P3]MDX5566690.1 DUF3558 domain-containing protein [Streptomyces sp. ID05-04B]